MPNVFVMQAWLIFGCPIGKGEGKQNAHIIYPWYYYDTGSGRRATF